MSTAPLPRLDKAAGAAPFISFFRSFGTDAPGRMDAFSHPSAHQPVAVAVSVQPSAAAQRKARRGVPLGIELHKLQPFVRSKGEKRYVMPARHRVADGDVKFVLHRLDGDLMLRVRLLALERRERHAAAAHDRRAERVQHVAAHRADIERAAAHIRRNVPVDDRRAAQQLDHRYAERRGERLEKRYIRQAPARFP